MKMPRGKFVGMDISNLPNWYLKWVAENWNEDTVEGKALCSAADKEFQLREKHNIVVK